MIKGQVSVKHKRYMNRVIKIYGGVELKPYSSLTSAQEAGKWSDSCTGYFSPTQRAPLTTKWGGSLGPRTSTDTLEKGSSLATAGNQSPIPQLSRL
jgi:hypothetical protein